MVITNDETAITEPGVSRIVVGEVCIILSSSDLIIDNFEVRSIKFQVSVKLLSGNDDNSRINCAERDLFNCLKSRIWHQVHIAKTSLPFPIPDDDTSICLAASCHQTSKILGTEVNGDEFLGWVLGRYQNLPLFHRHFENRL